VAIHVQEILIDDLDGSTDNVTTRRFGLEDLSYEIDLTPANLERLRAALGPFIAAGRRLPKSSRAKTSRSTRAGAVTRRTAPGAAARTAGAR